MRHAAFTCVHRIFHNSTSKSRHQSGKTVKNAISGKMTCFSNIATISVIANLILGLFNISSLCLNRHDFMSIYRSCLLAVQRPQSGTTGNLMCKTQCTATLNIKPAFYWSDDLMAVVDVLFYFAHVRHLPRRYCPASTIWNHWELDVQNTTKGHFTYKTRVLWIGRPNGSGQCHILLRTSLTSASPWLSSGNNLEPLGTWCAKHNQRPFCL